MTRSEGEPTAGLHPSPGFKACHCCGLVHELPALAPNVEAQCSRCRTTIWSPSRRAHGQELAFAASVAALLLYPAAIGLPIMHVEQFGHKVEASVWSGSVGLLARGELFVGIVVLVCSIVLPLGKLLGIVLLTRGGLPRSQRARTYRWIELAGRWGMLDVLLIAVVVAWVKIGDLVDISPGPAALAFTLCVLLSLLASASFDPHAIWESEDPQALALE